MVTVVRPQKLAWTRAGIVALVSARGAILADAATFATSAVLIGVFVRHRAVPAARPSRGWTRTADEGFRLVFRDDVLRANLVLAWIGAAAITAPEGLMTSLAGQPAGRPEADRGAACRHALRHLHRRCAVCAPDPTRSPSSADPSC